MSTPRRRLVRPVIAPPAGNLAHAAKNQKLRQRLHEERTTLSRWMTRLTRAFHVVAKAQKRISKLEKQLHNGEES